MTADTLLITAIIQARISSTRLPRKVLLPLGGRTVLENVVERTKKARCISNVIVATSQEKDDDEIVNLCRQKGISNFRGNLNDVLDRYYQCTKAFRIKHICRITGDCPLVDPLLIDKVAKTYQKRRVDYVSSAYPISTYPDGLEVEIFSFKALERTWREARLPSEREHVTPYIWKHSEKFKIYNVKSERNLSSYRWTIDEEQDYEFLNIVFDHVSPLTTPNILRFLQAHPEVQAINAGIKRNEGYKKSLKKDGK